MAAFVLNSTHWKHNTADRTDQKKLTASLIVSFAKIKQSWQNLKPWNNALHSSRSLCSTVSMATSLLGIDSLRALNFRHKFIPGESYCLALLQKWLVTFVIIGLHLKHKIKVCATPHIPWMVDFQQSNISVERVECLEWLTAFTK